MSGTGVVRTTDENGLFKRITSKLFNDSKLSPKKNISAIDNSLAIDNSGVANQTKISIENAKKYGSHLNVLLEGILENSDFDADSSERRELFSPDEKLDFNHVQLFSDDISDLASFLYKIEEIIDEIDNAYPGARERFLNAIYKSYKEHKNDLLLSSEIDLKDSGLVLNTIRHNADVLIRNVGDSIVNRGEVDLYGFPIEEVKDSVALIVCFGFVNCKILERPDDY
ncbi:MULTISPECIES: hypothetical protein [unclassified Pseudoalteromonas]|uniref:hypothetical protein n=1 Tax=unclassified Pseudoalteromonas TaxID=194690 RepID=UPI0005A93CA4|nr:MULTISPECIES: hypothetical protein [unclassified Pseudoalteromonas]